MKRLVLVGVVALLAGCHKSGQSDINLTLTTSFASGSAVMACKSSSTGSCEALFVTGPTTSRLSAAVGKTATQTGLSATTVFCVDAAAPDPAKCLPQPLPNGEQIVRRQVVSRKS
jgi:uncharacterized membrane protein YdcZ (DUF606 family)